MSNITRIRVTVSRHLDESEQEWIRALWRIGDNTIGFTNWNGMTYRWTKYPFHIRINDHEKLWVESKTVESRRLFRMVNKLVKNNFVNVHPTAVRTFCSISPLKDEGLLVEDIFEEEAARRGWRPPADPDQTVWDYLDGTDEEEDWEVVGLVDV